MAWGDIVFCFSCGGHGTRLQEKNSRSLAKVLYPLDEDRGLTTLEYHLRLLSPPARIAIAAGQHQHAILEYLEKHNGFGHNWRDFCWIPEKYQKPEIIGTSTGTSVPDFPYGAAAWLVFEESFIRSLQDNGIAIIVQTAGNKVGERLDIVNAMIDQLRSSSAECLTAVFHDTDLRLIGEENWRTQYDFVHDGKVHFRGYDEPKGQALAYWYLFKIDSLSHLWNIATHTSIKERARRYSQRRQWYVGDQCVELRVVDLNFPLLLEYFKTEVFEVSYANEDSGIQLKTVSDIPKCREIFERREQEGILRAVK